jgi:PAS domain S-box-containing protein
VTDREDHTPLPARWFAVIWCAVATTVFFVDLSMPLGVAGGVPYVALVLLAAWSPRHRSIFILAAIGTALTILGYFLSPPGGIPWVVLTNRGLALFAIWVTAILLSRRKGIEAAVSQELERRVAQRTAELSRAHAGLQSEVVEREAAETRLRESYRAQNALNALLRTSLETLSLEEQLERALDIVLSVPWLSVQPRGAIFLKEDDSRVLTLKAHRRLRAPLLATCEPIPVGPCPRGLAAATGQIQHGSRLDDRHENRYEGMTEHGHYSVPIASHGAVLGVLLLYLSEGHERDVQEAEFLEAVGSTLALMIRREQAEQKLRHREQRIRGILDNVADAVVTIDAVVTMDDEGRIESFNRAAEQTFGYAAHEVLGHNVSVLMPEPDRSAHDGFLRSYHRTGRSKIVGVGPRRVRGQRKNGSTFPIELAVSEFYMGEKRVFIGVTRDISRRVRREAELQRAKNAAEAANRSKSTFLANMSHELRTPLNAIIGFSELLTTGYYGSLNEKQREYVGDIHASGSHLVALINDFLDLSKIEAGKLELIEEAVDLVRLVEAVLRLFKERAAGGRIKLVNWTTEGSPPLYADERIAKQMLMNLLSNAVKFTPAGGQVTVSAAVDGAGRIRLAVSDTGLGIAEEDIPKALEPYGQVGDVETRRHDGTGLGLPLVKAFAELHGGELRLESEVDVGTTVTITFPPERTVRPAIEQRRVANSA